jgi:hypothetical protein
MIAVDALRKPYIKRVLAQYRVVPAAGPGVGEITKL